MTTILHVWGFGAYPSHPEDIVSNVSVSTHEGDLADVANGVLGAIEHPKQVATVRTLDGRLREVHAVVTVNPDSPMWHRFLTASEQWPTRKEAER